MRFNDFRSPTTSSRAVVISWGTVPRDPRLSVRVCATDVHRSLQRAVPVFHKRITFLIGPKVSEHFFKAKDSEMSQKEVYEFNVPTFGKGVVGQCAGLGSIICTSELPVIG